MTHFYGHSLDGQVSDDWQLLYDHLVHTAKLAEQFARPFDAGNFGHLLGLFHDLGKFSTEFQTYIGNPAFHEKKSSSPDHSSAGAQFLHHAIPGFGTILAYAIAGHHAGLPDYLRGGRSSLSVRLSKEIAEWQNEQSNALCSRIDSMKLLPPSGFRAVGLLASPAERAFMISLFTRMLYSCLVDADFLDTESFMMPLKAAARPVYPHDVMTRMEQALNDYIKKFQNNSPVNAIRADVLKECLNSAERPGNIFSLTVPTGGGKTLSSLAFALKHARLNGKCRIIYVLPYVTITEQTADAFRQVFKNLLPDPVLEVHSNLIQEHDADDESDDGDHDNHDTAKRLAAENFDAPLVVTTTVQFYESLMANRSSRCRKLHNFSHAVIILDEAQKIPLEYMTVMMSLFNQLTKVYHATLLLCTATQPAIHYDNRFFTIGLPADEVTELIADPESLFKKLRRTTFHFLGRKTDSELLHLFQQESSMLAIVNTRKHAAKLFSSLNHREGDFHLSTNLCPEHRRSIISTIRSRLDSGLPCRVISTQLMEAGVDLDFPVVYRSLAGCDSLIQAAGRCNRNGKSSPENSPVYVFESEWIEKERFQSVEMSNARQIISCCPDISSLDAMELYFKNLYYDHKQEWDRKGIMSCFSSNSKEFSFDFARAAHDFHLINDATVSVLIPYGKGKILLEELRAQQYPDLNLLRRLQPYSVSMQERDYHAQLGRNIDLLFGSIPVLISEQLHYDRNLGLNFEHNDDQNLINL